MFDKYFSFNNRIYYIDVEKIIEFCLKSENKNVRDSEITEGYEKLTDESNVLTLTSRVIRENTGTSNPQNDMITYDIFKTAFSVAVPLAITVPSSFIVKVIPLIVCVCAVFFSKFFF